MPLITVILLAAALLLSSGCKKHPKPEIAALPPFFAPAREPMAEPEPIPLAPAIHEPGMPTVAKLEGAEIFGEPGVPPGPPAEPEPAVVAPPPPTPIPSLAPLVSVEERRRFNVEIDSNLERTRRNIRLLRDRKLTARQATALDRVRGFVRQAESVRDRDPATAAGLASRAAILSRELVNDTR